MIDETIYNILKTVNANTYPGAIEQEINPPFISHRQLSMEPYPTKDGASTVDILDYQVGSFAETKAEVMTMAAAIRAALDEYSATGIKIRISDQKDSYDEESQLYVVIQNFRIRLKQ